MPTFNRIRGEESSTTTFKAATLTQTRNSSVMHQEIVSIGDTESSLGIAAVLATTPASTAWGLVIRIPDSTLTAVSSLGGVVTVSPNAGSTFATRPLQSSAADLQVTATPAAGSTFNVRPLQSSAADLQVTATPAAGSTFNVRPLQSSQADLRITAYQSTAAEFVATVRLQDGSGNALESSTQTNSSGGRGLFVRPLIPGSTTYAGSTAGESTMTALFSSAATNRLYVYAYSITSTAPGPITCSFCNSSGGSTLWVIRLASISSAISGANMAVTPPGYLFRNSTGANLTYNVTTTNVGGAALSVAAFRSS